MKIVKVFFKKNRINRQNSRNFGKIERRISFCKWLIVSKLSAGRARKRVYENYISLLFLFGKLHSGVTKAFDKKKSDRNWFWTKESAFFEPQIRARQGEHGHRVGGRQALPLSLVHEKERFFRVKFDQFLSVTYFSRFFPVGMVRGHLSSWKR